MGQPLGGGPLAVEAAVAGVPLLVVCAAALSLRLQYRRYGRGVRVRTRATLDGALPSRLVRYSAPREEPVSARPGSPAAAP
ncbi:hypothetical protein MRI28_25675 [Nocardiopsis dassonvillei]|uniref:hypothetical protein n=1 Tax=Nocardiopsis dassonvillei TaxID=2014 RepID=UPI00200E6C82|nr:hypothetical protein [Nocardiopsis dassonvillei]MCK9872979.1 hypothetical protein [Nocardiopsis dassonvillei]